MSGKVKTFPAQKLSLNCICPALYSSLAGLTHWPGPLIKILLFLLLWSNLYCYVREIKPMQKKYHQSCSTLLTPILLFTLLILLLLFTLLTLFTPFSLFLLPTLLLLFILLPLLTLLILEKHVGLSGGGG